MEEKIERILSIHEKCVSEAGISSAPSSRQKKMMSLLSLLLLASLALSLSLSLPLNDQ
jgi:hypothetical protein